MLTVRSEEDARSMVILFGSLVHAGELKGRYVYRKVGAALSDNEAVDRLIELSALMGNAYRRLLERRRS